MNFERDGYTASNASLQMLIKAAYGLENYQVVDTRNLLGSTNYDVQAKIDADTAAELNRLTQEQRKKAQRQMLQGLLADRFRLIAHQQSKELQVYFLVAGKNGPKFRESKPGDDYSNGLKTRSGALVGPHMGIASLKGGAIAVQGLPIDSLVSSLARELRSPVLDKTGLTGVYDFSLQWQPASESIAASENSGVSIFEAVQDQLGLTLEPARAPVTVLVIDGVEPPSPN
jgi:uncharacterized protein (TIGR03435 family)